MLSLDLLAVDADPREAVQVLDEEMAVLAHEPPVLAGDVLLRQADHVGVVAPDGDLVAQDGDDGAPSLVVFDDELHGVASPGRESTPTAELSPSAYLPRNCL